MNIEKPLILFGTGRSGTTILMEAIFRHRTLAYFSNYLEKKPEFNQIDYVRYFFDNRFYRLFGKKEQIHSRSLHERFIFKPSEAYPVWSYLCQDRVNFNKSFLYNVNPSEKLKKRVDNYCCEVMRIQNKSNFGFKITGPGRLGFLHQIFPDSKKIWLKRKFIPTLNSFLNVDFWQDRKTQELWREGPYNQTELVMLEKHKDDPIIFTAIQLKKIIDTIEIEIEKNDLEILEIEYEKLMENPEENLRDILNFAELDSDPYCFDYLKKNKFINQNKKNGEYFEDSTLEKLSEVLGEDYTI